MEALSRQQVRDLDRIALERFGIPGIVLMENAGRGATESFLRRFSPDTNLIGILCGKGNNGGDGFVIARHLANRGHRVEVLLLGDRDSFCRPGEAGANFAIVQKMGLTVTPVPTPPLIVERLNGCAVAVDAILGTGLTGEVRGLARAAIDALNTLGAKRVFAVDIPSGLDCDSGTPLGTAVRAGATATFAAMKKGFESPAARAFTGPVEVVDIGCPLVWR